MGRRMMIFADRFKSASPTILTVVAIGGLVATVVSAFKAAPEVEKRKKEAEEEHMTTTETVVHVAPAVLPTVGFGIGTAVCIIGSNGLNRKQQASLVSSYAVAERLYYQYRDKVRDILGRDGDCEVIQEIAKDHLEMGIADDVPEGCEEDDGMKLYYDIYGDRYFRRRPEKVKEAEYQLNRKFAVDGRACLNDWYDFNELEHIDYGKTVGWDQCEVWDRWGYQWLDFWHKAVVTDDGLECEVIYFVVEPEKDYLD